MTIDLMRQISFKTALFFKELEKKRNFSGIRTGLCRMLFIARLITFSELFIKN